MTYRVFLIVAVAVLCAACDPQAKADGTGLSDDAQLSRAGESCGASLHCETGLRCLQQVCRGTESSVLGDYYWAAGDLAMASNEVQLASELYTQSVNQYEADKVPPPPQLYCAQGKALAGTRDEPTRAELAARVLHRCLLGAAPYSALRKQALRDLALLQEVGLDPLLLARDAPADKYLTKQAAAPSADEISVTAKHEGRGVRHKSFTDWMDLLGSAKVKQALFPCWEQYFEATRESSLTASLTFRHGFSLDQYDDFARSTLAISEVGGGDDRAKAVACVREALLPVADEFSRGSPESTWRAVIDITIGE